MPSMAQVTHVDNTMSACTPTPTGSRRMRREENAKLEAQGAAAKKRKERKLRRALLRAAAPSSASVA